MASREIPPMTSTTTHDGEDDTTHLPFLITALLATQRASWEQGVAAQAILETYLSPLINPPSDPVSISDSHVSHPASTARGLGLAPLLLPTLYALTYEAIVRQSPVDGRFCVEINKGDPGATDPCCIGEALLFITRYLREQSNGGAGSEGAEVYTFETALFRMLTFITTQAPRVSWPVGCQNSYSFLLGGGDTTIPDLPPPISHRIDLSQCWSDAPYMLAPFLVSYGIYTASAPTISEGLLQILSYAQILQINSPQPLGCPKPGLWSHIYDSETRSYSRADKWGVGNGWVCAGVLRCLRILFPPEGPSAKSTSSSPLVPSSLLPPTPLIAAVTSVFLSTLTACLHYLDPETSLFHDIIDNPTTTPPTRNFFPETNLPQILSYSIYRFLSLKRTSPPFLQIVSTLPPLTTATTSLDDETLLHYAERMSTAARGMVDKWGFVRNVCGSPRFDRPGTAAEGQAFGVLMEVARGEFWAGVSGSR